MFTSLMFNVDFGTTSHGAGILPVQHVHAHPMMAPTDGQAQACSALLRASLRKQRNIIDRTRSSPAAAAQRRRCPGMRRCRRHCAAGTARALPAGTPPPRRRKPCPTSFGRLPAPLTAYIWCKACAAVLDGEGHARNARHASKQRR